MAIYPKMTLAQLRTASRQRADMVNSTFISEAELNSYINASYFELYDLLVQKYGNDYYMTQYSFQLEGNVSRYNLPKDFFKLLGVDLQISAGPDGYVSLRPFTLAERNRYSTANVQTWIGVTNLRYRLSGNKLWFTPSPQTGQTIRIWYVPRLVELVDDVTLTVGTVVAGDFLKINDVELVAGTDFAIGATPTDTANNIFAALPSDLSYVVTASQASPPTNVITFSMVDSETVTFEAGNNADPEIPGADARLDFSCTQLGVADGVSGWLEYVVTDVAIKMLQKEESDTSVAQFQKAALIKRIEAAAENRDAGNPATIADVQWTNGTWPFGNGFGGGGGIP